MPGSFELCMCLRYGEGERIPLEPGRSALECSARGHMDCQELRKEF